ncbi:DNA topoisomerase I [Desulfonauticus submarinus]|uniref:DNA topoisomerase 1 n=1 Tax=Desulfonauticus submarinus TaxID=206665 RepID=A0A1H0FYN1_9BACT|nr:type I DNA topoisomerase [Desulfonauticus submarinus]SDN99692.1 DNA topoisomerase I [Desulfonauticus submarinus]
MATHLIIVESPAKVKTIKKFLGKGYKIEASLGHIRDLPTKELGVTEGEEFLPTYVIIPGKEKVVNKLQKIAAKVGNIYLAPDPDREGEAIAWHIAEVIKQKNSNFLRIQFNEITKRAVLEALNNPRSLDEKLFNSQQARRILDRLVGYKISPLLWKKVQRGLSAGRVQSVALRLLVEREKERYSFQPQEYWVFKALLKKSEYELQADLVKISNKKAKITNEKQASELKDYLAKQQFILHKIEQKQQKRNPKPPFITSTLQQEANIRFNFSASRTMSIAQRLYEGVDLGEKGTIALITYMRTDSVRIAPEAQKLAREWIKKTLGSKYCPPKAKKYKTKSTAQDAHEAIRPVDPTLTPEEIRAYLPADQFKLYKLIWERFIASQMTSATILATIFHIQAGKTLWQTKGEQIAFPGFLKIYSPGKIKENLLPNLTEGTNFNLEKLDIKQKFTQPPARYSEATLVKKMEELGIGRPSTYATIISTLLARKYALLEEKQLIPTELGMSVCDLLIQHFPKLLDVNFTAKMEEELDKIAIGEKDWQEVLREFAKEFYPTLEAAQKEMRSLKNGEQTEIKCSKCGNPMLVKFGKNGPFLACSNYPKCKNTSNFKRTENGEIVLIKPEEQPPKIVGKCPKCGNPVVEKKARTGARFLACSNYPKCNYTASYSTKVPCPEQGCDGELVERSTKKGKIFYACSNYPKCKFAVWNYPVAQKCPKCGFSILVKKESKARGEYLACPVKGCRYWEKIE